MEDEGCTTRMIKGIKVIFNIIYLKDNSGSAERVWRFLFLNIGDLQINLGRKSQKQDKRLWKKYKEVETNNI